jgi:hypothetical protein
MTDAELKAKLVAMVSNKKWAALTSVDLDAGYAALTVAEKQVIVDSLRAGDDKARSLIKLKFSQGVDAFANSEADRYIALGYVPNSDFSKLVD